MVLFTIPEMIFPQLFWMCICCVIVALTTYYVFIPKMNKVRHLRSSAVNDMRERINNLLEHTQNLEQKTRKLEGDMHEKMQSEIIKLYKEFERKAEEEIEHIRIGMKRNEQKLTQKMKQAINELKADLSKKIPEISKEIIKKFEQ